MTTPQGAMCTDPSKSKSFPTNLSFPIDSEKYSVLGTPTPLGITFQWATRTTPPEFESSNRGSLLPEPGESTLRYNERTYKLTRIQISKPTHTSWVIPVTAQPQNLEDVILTFLTTDVLTDQPNIIIIVIPILRAEVSATDSAYLKALADPNLIGAGTSPASLFPARETDPYAYYSVCATGYAKDDPPQNILVVTLIRGLYISNATMNAVLANYNSVAQDYGTYEPPTSLVFSMTTGTFDMVNFQTQVKYGYNIIAAVATQPPPKPKTESVSAGSFQCVPLDPATQIKDGALVVDTTTGQPLSAIEDQRKSLIQEATQPPPNKMTPDMYIEKVSGALSIILAIAVIVVLINFFFSVTDTGSGVPGETAGEWKRFFMTAGEIPLPIIVGLLAGFLGFFIGIVISNQ